MIQIVTIIVIWDLFYNSFSFIDTIPVANEIAQTRTAGALYTDNNGKKYYRIILEIYDGSQSSYVTVDDQSGYDNKHW